MSQMGLVGCSFTRRAVIHWKRPIWQMADRVFRQDREQIASQSHAGGRWKERPGAWGSLHIDDEVFRQRRNVLIENGILKRMSWIGWMAEDGDATDRIRQENVPFCSGGKNDEYLFDAGEDDPKEMIRSVMFGLYVKNIHAGSVNPGYRRIQFSHQRNISD